MKQAVKLILLLGAILWLSPAPAGYNFQTKYDQVSKVYATSGQIDTPISFAVAQKVGVDYLHYRDWALKNINGDPGSTHKFMAEIKDTIYKDRLFKVHYDLNLVWPFSREDETIDFKLRERVNNDRVLAYVLTLGEDNIAISDFEMNIELQKVSDVSSRVNVRANVKLSPFLNPFFSMDDYRKNIEWRIIKIVQNLEERLAGPQNKISAPQSKDVGQTK